MAKTFVQQSQISGSLSADVADDFNAAQSLARAEGANSTLFADLNDLRRQVNRIIGEGSWTAALAGQQDLSDIYAAMHVDGSNVEFQGDITGSAALKVLGAVDFQDTLAVTGVATFTSDITGSAGMQLAGALDVNGSADVQGAVNLQDSLTVAGFADLNDGLDVALASDLHGAVHAYSTLQVGGVASFDAAITGSAGMDLTGGLAVDHVYIDGDNVGGRLYFVDPVTFEVQDSDKLLFDGSLLQITGSVDVSGAMTVGNGLTVKIGRAHV